MAQCDILLFGAAYHWEKPPDGIAEYRNWNPGLGVKTTMDGYTVTIARFKNSINEWSNFAGVGYDYKGLEASIGYLDGYKGPTIRPLIGAYYKYDRYSVHAVYMLRGVGFYLGIRL